MKIIKRLLLLTCFCAFMVRSPSVIEEMIAKAGNTHIKKYEIPINLYHNEENNLIQFFTRIKTFTESDNMLEDQLNLAYQYYCEEVEKKSYPQWTDIKQLATSRSGDTEKIMLSFLRFRELMNIYTLTIAVNRVFFRNSPPLKHICTDYSTLKTTVLGNNGRANLITELINILQNNDALKTNFAKRENYYEFYDCTKPILRVIAPGSLTPFSDIDQTFYIEFNSLEEAKITHEHQVELIKHFDDVFFELMGNTSFNTFDLNSYVSGVGQEMMKCGFFKESCDIRMKTKEFHYLNIYYSLIGFKILENKYSKNNESPYKQLNKISDDIINVLDSKYPTLKEIKKFAEIVENYNTQNGQLIEKTMVKLTSMNEVENPLARPADSPLKMQLSRLTQEQQFIYKRNVGYYNFLKQADIVLKSAINKLAKGRWEKPEMDILTTIFYKKLRYQTYILGASYVTNEAYYTAGAIVHAVGDQMFGQGRSLLMKYDLITSYLLNFNMGMDHFTESYNHYITNPQKSKFYLLDSMQKLSKYMIRCHKALFRKYITDCKSLKEDQLYDEKTFIKDKHIEKTYQYIITKFDEIIKIKNDPMLIDLKIKNIEEIHDHLIKLFEVNKTELLSQKILNFYVEFLNHIDIKGKVITSIYLETKASNSLSNNMIVNHNAKLRKHKKRKLRRRFK